jgi:hypothetical protein
MLLILMVIVSCKGRQALKEDTPDFKFAPKQYRKLYRELDDKLRQLSSSLHIQSKTKSNTSFGVELLVANSNRGEILLTDRVLKATVLTLDRLKDLGVKSVSLSIQYPILTRPFPRSAEYRRFYQQVVREIRSRGFVLIVEIGTIFREPEFSKIQADYNGLTMDRFSNELFEMAEIIIEDLHPDYLTLFTEPETHSRNTGLNFTVSNFTAVVQHVAKGLTHPKVKIGAGAGTWDDLAYFSALTRISELDYIDLHIYPIQRNFVVDRVMRIAKLAQNHGKSVTIGETWLYKVSSRELGRISPVKAFARDVYSFWQPLDTMFVEFIFNISRQINAEFCSFFWMKYFYGYLDYSSKTKDLRAQQLITAADATAGRNIVSNTLNETGWKFKTLVDAQH